MARTLFEFIRTISLQSREASLRQGISADRDRQQLMVRSHPNEFGERESQVQNQDGISAYEAECDFIVRNSGWAPSAYT